MARVCKVCNQTKPFTEFKPDPTCANGYRHICLVCFRKQQSERYHGIKHDPECRARIVASRRKWDLKSKYAITEQEYDALLTAQGGACLLCGNQNGSKRLAVDHCHNTSKVRGLLCTNCNVGIGMFRHDPELLEKAKNYLK